mgnify:CR=1 FL=1
MADQNIFDKETLELLATLKDDGIVAYPLKYFPKNKAKEILEDFDGYNEKVVSIAGRIVTKRLRTRGKQNRKPSTLRLSRSLIQRLTKSKLERLERSVRI